MLLLAVAVGAVRLARIQLLEAWSVEKLQRVSQIIRMTLCHTPSIAQLLLFFQFVLLP